MSPVPRFASARIGRVAIVVGAVLAMFVFLAASDARANWLPQKTLKSPDGVRASVAVAAPDGTVTVVWTSITDQAVYAQRIRKSGKAPASGRKTLLSGSDNVQYLAAAVDGAGAVTVAWRRSEPGTQSIIQARRINANGQPEPGTHLITSYNGLSQHIGVASAPNGRSAVVWQNASANQISARQISPIGALSATVNFHTVAAASGEPKIIAAPAGNPRAGEFMVAWIEYVVAETTYRVRVQPFLPDNSKGAFTTVNSGFDQGGFLPQLVYRPNGRVVVSWTSHNAVGNQIVVRTVDSEGTVVGEPLSISDPSGAVEREHRMVISGNRITVLYAQQVGVNAMRHRIRRLNPNGSLGPVRTPFGSVAEYVDSDQLTLVATSDGGALAGGMLYTYEGPPVEPKTQFRQLTPAGKLGALLTKPAATHDPVAVAGRKGSAAAIWGHSGTSTALRFQRWDPKAKSKLKVVGALKAKPALAAPGQTVTVPVKVKNAGPLKVKNVKACAKPRGALKAVFAAKCVKIGKIGIGKSKKGKLKLPSKVAGAIRGNAYRLKIVVTGSQPIGKAKKATKTVTIRF